MQVKSAALNGLARMLRAHPHVEFVSRALEAAVEFTAGGRTRRIWIDRPDVELFGLVELIDNNPLVCADEFSLPSPEATLALIALGPLLRAGILCEPPAALFSFEADEESLAKSLAKLGWDKGLTVDTHPQDLGSILAATFVAIIDTPDDETLIDSLFDGIYGSSFYIRRSEHDLDGGLVPGTQVASYRLRYAPDEGQSLLTVQVMADSAGKCGAGQVVHAFNVMCGFEESLGIADGVSG